ncbi:MAG: glycosyltransferase family 2 protein, partial [Candidatus Omnitrophota bacterium]
MKLSIIIPTYNEELTIEQLIRLVESVSYPIDHEIIIVNDASTDSTLQKDILKQISKDYVKLLNNRENKGKGICISQGIGSATGDIIIIQDADLEYNPQDIPRLIQPIINGEAEVVYGSRFLKSKYPYGMAWPNYIANKFLTRLTNLLYRTNLTDMETCYKAIKANVIKNIRLRARRFEFEPELTAKIVKRKISIYELPISYRGRGLKQGKKIKPKDFFIAIQTLL